MIGGIPDDNIVQRNFGNKNICLYFDYEPVPYFAPALWTTLLLFYQHAIVLLQLFEFGLHGVKRKLPKSKGVFSISVFVFLALGCMIFSLIFAVQPKDHLALIIHTSPFIVLEVALGPIFL